MADEAVRVESAPMPVEQAQRLVARLALLGKVAIDAPHAKFPHLRIAGFILEADEHSFVGEGVLMMRALQVLAGLDIDTLNRGLMDRIDAPFDLASVNAETT